jgi:hypothetical protein
MRSLTTDVQNALTAGTVAPVYLVAVTFCSSPPDLKRCWTGTGTVTWGGNDYEGQGDLMGVSAITQTGDLAAEGITLSFSGIDSGNVSSAMSDVATYSRVDVWYGMLNLSTGAIIADPVHCFSGCLDVPTLQDDGESATISFTAENDLIKLSLASDRRYTNDDQQITYPTDNGFQFVPWVQLWNGAWGGASGHTISGGFF